MPLELGDCAAAICHPDVCPVEGNTFWVRANRIYLVLSTLKPSLSKSTSSYFSQVFPLITLIWSMPDFDSFLFSL
jgi:hypothetical protein